MLIKGGHFWKICKVIFLVCISSFRTYKSLSGGNVWWTKSSHTAFLKHATYNSKNQKKMNWMQTGRDRYLILYGNHTLFVSYRLPVFLFTIRFHAFTPCFHAFTMRLPPTLYFLTFYMFVVLCLFSYNKLPCTIK